LCVENGEEVQDKDTGKIFSEIMPENFPIFPKVWVIHVWGLSEIP
jgi:hypothetical protein